MASILFLAPTDLGESVLATGALAHVLGKGDRVTVSCQGQAQPLFRVFSQVGAMVSPMPGELMRPVVHLAKPFDLLLDLRGGGSSFFVRARRVMRRRTPKKLFHLSEEFADIVGAERAIAPQISIDEIARAKAAALASGPLIVLAPGGSDGSKRWAPERFAAVARRLHGGPLAGAQIVIVGAGVRDRDVTRSIVASLDADGVAASDLGEEFDLLDCAALMERATICVGNDNALVHIAAAMGAATLCLFGPTDERLRAPLGPRARGFRAMALSDVAALGRSGGRAAMDAIGIDAVEAAAIELLHAGGLG